jgi:hypothetical protein
MRDEPPTNSTHEKSLPSGNRGCEARMIMTKTGWRDLSDEMQYVAYSPRNAGARLVRFQDNAPNQPRHPERGCPHLFDAVRLPSRWDRTLPIAN